MDAQHALILHRDPRGVRLVQPIPHLSIVTLAMMRDALAQRWLLVHGDGELIDVAGHTFVPVGWVAALPPGLVVEHVCICQTERADG